ncbi:ras-related protein Rab-34 [Ptiloglossa arizonensis]|uniref:ras-related protein Rab-34 n=1 Tax=Ptiloglossa arizonensis TaxID=3350558 RepID=UPI003F9F76E4
MLQTRSAIYKMMEVTRDERQLSATVIVYRKNISLIILPSYLICTIMNKNFDTELQSLNISQIIRIKRLKNENSVKIYPIGSICKTLKNAGYNSGIAKKIPHILSIPPQSPNDYLLEHIDNWPPPFSSDITPYNERNFSTLVKRSCITKCLSLKISKAIVIGDVSVGKSCLVNQFCHKVFDNNYKATIGVDFEVEKFDILGLPFYLQIWDTAGQERFKSIAASYYRGANVIIVVFDLSNLISLKHCEQWLSEAAKSNTDQYHIFLVGTKRDLLSNQIYEIIEKRAAEVARKIEAEFWAISSRTGDKVFELFTRIAVLSFHAMVLHELQNRSSESINIGSGLITLNCQAERAEDRKKKSKCLGCSTLVMEY